MNWKRQIKKYLASFCGLNYCPFCDSFVKFRPFGKDLRPRAECPFCGSLERHRFLLAVYRKMVLNSEKPLRLLHTAPETMFAKLFQKEDQIAYTSIDLFPEMFPEVSCIKADVTKLPFEDGTFDVIISNHVLEHIPEEQKCLAEFQRVLAPQGRAFLTFPVDLNLPETLEDPAIQTSEERLKYYGQADHVRLYGQDAEKRLGEFFRVQIITADAFIPYGNQHWDGAAYCFLLTHKN